MQNLSQIYKKFLTLFKTNKNKIKNQTSSQEEYDASILFGLLNKDNDSVDIKCTLPNVTHKSIEEIMIISEKYAELLAYLNTEQFNKHIYQILNDNKKQNNDNYKYVMLIDNIIHFWDVFYNLENKKQYQKYKTDQPLIRPSQAFILK